MTHTVTLEYVFTQQRQLRCTIPLHMGMMRGETMVVECDITQCELVVVSMYLLYVTIRSN